MLFAPLPGLLPEAPRLWLRCLSCFDVPTRRLKLTRGDTRLKWDGGKKNVYRSKTACSREVSSLLGNFQQISVISFCLSIRNKPRTDTSGRSERDGLFGNLQWRCWLLYQHSEVFFGSWFHVHVFILCSCQTECRLGNQYNYSVTNKICFFFHNWYLKNCIE